MAELSKETRSLEFLFLVSAPLLISKDSYVAL